MSEVSIVSSSPGFGDSIQQRDQLTIDGASAEVVVEAAAAAAKCAACHRPEVIDPTSAAPRRQGGSRQAGRQRGRQGRLPSTRLGWEGRGVWWPPGGALTRPLQYSGLLGRAGGAVTCVWVPQLASIQTPVATSAIVEEGTACMGNVVGVWRAGPGTVGGGAATLSVEGTHLVGRPRGGTGRARGLDVVPREASGTPACT